MDQIRYNKREEAYEITYKLWEKDMTVRFYVEEQKTIIDNISEIAKKLDKVNNGRKQIAEAIASGGYYRGFAETLAENMQMDSVYVDIDDDGVVVCFTVEGTDGCLAPIAVEYGFEDMTEVVGWA